jgi:hypothetical protein
VTLFGRHPNLLIALLLMVVAVLVIVAIVGLGAPATQVPNGAIGDVPPVPAAAPTPTPTPPPVSVPEKSPVAVESPSTFEMEPGVMADCGRIDRAACEQAITLAKSGNEGDIVGTTLIVVDDSCPPATECDPHLPFDAIVVFVTAGGDTTGWYAYHVVATDATVPEKAERWQAEIPAHIVDRIRAALATP